MSANTNQELIDLMTAKILSGNSDTTAQNVRDLITAMINSYQNLNDKNVANGYPGLDSSAKLPLSFLSQAVQTNSFLNDSGNFIPRSKTFRTGGAAVLTNDYTSFVYTGAGNTWTLFQSQGNGNYFIVNRGSGSLILNYPGGANKILELQSNTLVNTLTITPTSLVILIDDGTNLIAY